MSKVIEFPPERTADGRQRALMGLPMDDLSHTEIRLNQPQNVSFFSAEHWESRLKWQRETLSGRLKQMKLKFNILLHQQTKGQLINLQSARDQLRLRGR